ncbi:MAG: hypothetical protein HC785_29115 [Calothrix sp. CSU_2_0]|nr:hypothetical protein [Calothrix sp. CSU_2_0]
MTDKYTEKQLNHYDNAKSEAEKEDALYRLGTHLEIIPCNGDSKNIHPEMKDAILDAAKGEKQ